MARKQSRSRRGRPGVSWTFLRDSGRTIYCSRCGGSAPVELPMEVKRLVRLIDGFNLMHADCTEDEMTEAGDDGPTGG